MSTPLPSVVVSFSKTCENMRSVRRLRGPSRYEANASEFRHLRKMVFTPRMLPFCASKLLVDHQCRSQRLRVESSTWR